MLQHDAAKLAEKASVILLDIEGTTTSISFVKDQLFPYVRNHLEDYINFHWGEPELERDIQALKEQVQEDIKNDVAGIQLIPELATVEDTKKAILANVIQQMDKDRKTTALKQLQGHIWKAAYESNSIHGHLYPDVVPALQKWQNEGKQIYIYSSGSVQAQKLLFGHSQEGDLLKFFSGHFDTLVGSKTEPSSYSEIANQIGVSSDKILFFTDVPKEAKAAATSGMKAVLVERDGNQPLTLDDRQNYPSVMSFKDT